MAMKSRTDLDKLLRFGLTAALWLLAGGLSPVLGAEPKPEHRLRALEQSLPARPKEARLRDEWETLRFYVRKMQYAAQTYPPSFERQALLDNHLRQAERIRDALIENRTPPVVYGLREEAYYCDTDNSYQPFLRYLPQAARKGKPLPMLVYLHGYSPFLDIVNWSTLDPPLIAFAEQDHFLIVAPFGRSNTDFQNIGELDVLRAIEEMKRRYAVDTERIVLSGFSMGGMGVWTIGAHHPDAFAGLLPIAARGDYYFWHGVRREALPSYKRDLIDAEFGYSMLDRLKSTPVFSLHGSADWLISVGEGRHMAQAVRRVNPHAVYVELEGKDHWITEAAFQREDLREWLRTRRRPNPTSTPHYNTSLLPSPVGPVKRAFLSPFIFVCAGGDPDPSTRLRQAAREWERYAKASPRTALERAMSKEALTRYNVFLYGEPETSALIRTVFETSPVKAEGKHFKVGERTFAREGHGLYLARPSPWNPDRLAVVQSGIPWGEGLPENHKYDFLPDYIVYGPDRDEDGSNTALCAGFFDKNGELDMKRQYRREE